MWAEGKDAQKNDTVMKTYRKRPCIRNNETKAERTKIQPSGEAEQTVVKDVLQANSSVGVTVSEVKSL